MPHGLPALLFHCNLYIKKATSDKIIKKILTFLFFKKEKKRIKLILFLLFFFFGKNMKNLETSNPSVPPTFKDSKYLQQTQNPYTIRISHSHYKPKFTQNNNWNLSSSLSIG